MNWYEDPIYIKMCEKAWEIQDGVEVGGSWIENYILCTRTGSFYHVTDTIGMRKCESCGNKEDYIEKSKCIWLPRQDQLQEMVVGLSPHDLSYKFAFFCNPMKRYRVTFKGFPDEYYENGKTPNPPPDIWTNEGECNYPLQFTSMEQLCLAFVYKEKYNKGWNGEEWIEG